MTRKVLPALLGVAALSLTSVVAQEDAEEASDEPMRCLSMNSIRSTKVLDDSRVLFFNARDKVYLNRLDRECLGLSRSGTFEYRVQSGARHARKTEDRDGGRTRGAARRGLRQPRAGRSAEH